MTEQQIENLKKILSSSNQQPNSLDLDEKIITASKVNVPERKRFVDSWRENYQSLNLISSAAISLLLTVGLFLTLSFILSGNDIPNYQHAVVDTNNRGRVTVVEQGRATATTLTDIVLEQPITQHTRNQILASMQPVDIKVLLDDMKFVHTNDRVLAEIAVIEAMDDIRFMVIDGQLNSARERYDRLRRSCSVCSLPKTLEALVLNKVSSTSRS